MGNTLLAPLAMAVVVLLIERYGRQGIPVLLVGSAVYLVATVGLWLLILHSADYTSGLLLLLSPALLGGVAVLIGAVAGITHSIRSWPTNR